MAPDLPANFIAYNAQIVAVVLAAALVLRLLAIPAAGARYACWRLVVAICLVTPWLLRTIAVPAAVPLALDDMTLGALTQTTVPALDAGEAARWSLAWSIRRVDLVVALLALGVFLRAAWLAVGLCRLRRLRRDSVRVEDEVYDEMQDMLGTRASVRSSAQLAQPVTFGVWRPVVLVPDSLATSPEPLRRAVISHELLHVQRRDWVWVLVEEVVRTLFWFQPAIWWATSRIQLAREELVDELTVLATGNRRTYIEALLAFADGASVRAAPAFARRAHLFTRILGLSKEHVMSTSRVIASGALVVLVLAGAAWSASAAFPVVRAAEAPHPIGGQDIGLPAERTWQAASSGTAPAAPAAQGARNGGAARPDPPSAPTPDAATKPITPENPIPRRLASVPIPYPAALRGTNSSARVGVRVVLDASGTVSDVRPMSFESSTSTALATGEPRRMEAFAGAVAAAIKQWRYAPPADPPIAIYVAVRFEPDSEGVATQSDSPVGPAFARGPVTRMAPGAPGAGAVGFAVTTGRAPLRVGGTIAPPAKTKDARPVYPELAKSSRVQGVVILETIIDEQGHVADARVLRSIPLLDQAAIDAVKQWEFTPTLLNGEPVPIIMTVTVQFSLAELQ